MILAVAPGTSATSTLLAAVVAIVVVIAAVAVVLARGRRRSRVRPALLEARDRLEPEPDVEIGGARGVLALAATVPAMRLARDVARAGVEVGRAGLAPVVAGGLRRIADYAEGDRASLSGLVARDGTLALLFSDIEGSTSLNERLGDEGWLELLHEHDAIVRTAVHRERGRVVKTLGDSFMVVFERVDEALRCATEVQRGMERLPVPLHAPLRVRIGVHVGDVTRRGHDVFGLDVAVAARVAAAAAGGEVVVSESARRHGSQAGFGFGRGRRLRLKGLSDPVTVYPLRP